LATKTSGSSKGKRLSTVLRGVVSERELENLKENSQELSLNRPIALEDGKKRALLYPNGILVKKLLEETVAMRKICSWRKLGFTST